MKSYRNNKVKEATTEELLFEIVTREGMQDGPTKTEYATPHLISDLPVGADHTASVIIDSEALCELQTMVAKTNTL